MTNSVKAIALSYCRHRDSIGYPLSDTPLLLHFLRNCIWMPNKEGNGQGFAFCQRDRLLRTIKRISKGEEELEIRFDTYIGRLLYQPYKKDLTWGDYEALADFLCEIYGVDSRD